LRGQLEVEVFRDNLVGRSFYSNYGFEPILRMVHEPTGMQVVRLRLAADTP
jgi:putative acetyltransferase